MAGPTTPVTFTGTLQLPADATLPADQVPFNAAVTITSAQPDQILNVAGSGTQAVPFGTVGSPGAKLVAVRYDAQAGAMPILLHMNGDTLHPIELTPGGFIILASPNPAAGITALTFDYTASCQVKVWIAG
jgi:hypothetical protein